MTTPAPTLSIVVPALNEEGNVALLVKRIDASLQTAGISYEVLFIDDFSKDGTASAVRRLARHYPVAVAQKIGKRGKAFSILQGVAMVRGDLICMIDADLQYPPEAIAPMVRIITDKKADVVLSRRISKETSFLRQFISKGYNLVFAKMLFGIDFDTQSGLKVFRRRVFDGLELQPSQWSFDLEFIVQCLARQYRVLSYDIDFAERHSGKAKISAIASSFEVLLATLSLRARVSRRQIRQGYLRSMAGPRRLGKATS